MLKDNAHIERRYRTEIVEICQPLRLPEAFSSGLDVRRLTLGSLFVRLRVRSPRDRIKLEEPPREIARRLTPRQRRYLTDIVAGQSSLDSLGPLDLELRKDIEQWLSKLSGSETLDPAQALCTYSQLAISGPGGSGKTTLLHWLALVCAEDRQADPVALGAFFNRRLLPILINLKEFATWRGWSDANLKTRPRCDLLALYVAERPEHDPACYQTLIAAINSGEAIILADGLDEILDRSLREGMTAFLHGFIGDEASQHCLVVITGRPHACPPGLFGPTIGDVELLPFRPADIRAYLVHHWYPTVYGADLVTEAEALATEIREAPALAQLAVNPLLCTLLAVNYRAGLRPLPKRRIVVFERCCKLLIHNWDEARNIPWPQGCAEETKLSLAAQLAFAALAESRDLSLTEDRARSLATEHLRKALGCSEDDARKAAEALLRAIRERAGLIEARSDESYQFLIRPFLDYLVARHIVPVKSEETSLDEETILDLIMPHVFDGAWREPIVMAAARMAETKQRDRFPKISRMLMAIVGVMRPPPWPRPPTTALVLSQRWRDQWRDRWLESRLLRLEDLTAQIIEEIVDYENASNPFRDVSRLITRRCRVCLSDKDAFVNRIAVDILGRLVLVEPEAEDALTAALRKAQTSTREAVARELGRRGISSRALDALADAIGDKDTAVQRATIEAIGMVGRFSPRVGSVLISAARDKDTEIRVKAIEALGRVGKLSAEATELLLTYLSARHVSDINWQAPSVRLAAAKALSSADPIQCHLTWSRY